MFEVMIFRSPLVMCLIMCLVNMSHQLSHMDEVVIRALGKLQENVKQVHEKQDRMMEAFREMKEMQNEMKTTQNIMQLNLENVTVKQGEIENTLKDVAVRQNQINNTLGLFKAMLSNTVVSDNSISIKKPMESKCLGPEDFLVGLQCFRMFRDVERSFEDAQAKCLSEHLILAEPADDAAAPLRKKILDKYGSGSYCWVGARGVTGGFRWQHSGASLLRDSPLWRTAYGVPVRSRYLSPSHCLMLAVHQAYWEQEPGRPYALSGCTSSYWTVCQVL